MSTAVEIGAGVVGGAALLAVGGEVVLGALAIDLISEDLVGEVFVEALGASVTEGVVEAEAVAQSLLVDASLEDAEVLAAQQSDAFAESAAVEEEESVSTGLGGRVVSAFQRGKEGLEAFERAVRISFQLSFVNSIASQVSAAFGIPVGAFEQRLNAAILKRRSALTDAVAFLERGLGVVNATAGVALLLPTSAQALFVNVGLAVVQNQPDMPVSAVRQWLSEVGAVEIRAKPRFSRFTGVLGNLAFRGQLTESARGNRLEHTPGPNTVLTLISHVDLRSMLGRGQEFDLDDDQTIAPTAHVVDLDARTALPDNALAAVGSPVVDSDGRYQATMQVSSAEWPSTVAVRVYAMVAIRRRSDNQRLHVPLNAYIALTSPRGQ